LLALGLCWGRRCLESQSSGETVGNLWRCHACIVSGSAPGAMRFECAGLCVSAAPRLPLARVKGEAPPPRQGHLYFQRKTRHVPKDWAVSLLG
jgi:hypothetical protein